MAMLLAPYNDAMRLGMGFNSFTQQLCINDAVKPAGGKLLASEKTLRPQYKLGTMTNVDGNNVDISQDVSWTAKFVDRISEVTDSMNVSGSLQIKCDAIGGGGSASASFIDTNKFKESDINYLIQVKVTNQRLVAPDLTDFCPIEGLPDSEFTRVYGDSFISGFTEGGEFYALVSIKLKDRSKSKEIRGKLKVDLNFQAASVSGEGELAKTDASSNIDGETTITVSWRGGGDIKDGTVVDWTLETLKAVAMEFPEHVMACPMRTNAILTKYTGLKSFYERVIKGTPLDYENAGVYSSALLDAYMDYKVMWRNIQTAAWEVEQGQSELIAKIDIPEFAELSREAKENYNNQLIRYREEMSEYERTYTIKESKDDGFVHVPSSTSDASSDVGVIVQSPPPVSQEGSSLPLAIGNTPAQSVAAEPQWYLPPPTAYPSPSSLPNGPALTPTPAPAPITVPTAPQPTQPNRSPSPTTRLAVLAKPPPPEPPMPPNDLAPYKATIFGLDKARRDCRFEMIKIVREVDAVARDPKVACDPLRTIQYLSPAVFRMLLPTIKNLDKEKAALLAAEAAKKLTEETAKEEETLRTDLTATQRKLEAAEEKARALEAAKKEIDPWEGCCPAPGEVPIRFRTFCSRKSLDFDWSEGRGGRSVHQFDTMAISNQKWRLIRAGPVGFLIQHVESNRYLTVGPRHQNDWFFVTTHELGSVFTFEPRPNGCYFIHLAEQPQWTLNLYGANQDNGGAIGLYSSPKGDCDTWYIKPWDDMNI